ncbi:MAG: hypothetical protein HPY83_08415 [Anaerolineae bacterium]|nr:hypothetical protein [Anaerolineae bacterium]
MLTSPSAYAAFVYGLRERFAEIESSTLVLLPRSPTVAVLRGELLFAGGIRLRVVEQVDFAEARIHYYSYTVYRGEERLYWYDPQPHPNDPSLDSTHPHHKHVPPDIRHNRIPAPGLSFERPNLPMLIEEVERALLTPEPPPT